MVASGMLPGLNRMLESADLEAYADVEAAVEDADSVRDAVEAIGILDALEADVAEEARAVLDAIPPAVDEAIIAALESAFERGVSVVLEWVEGNRGTIEVHVSEEPHRGGVRVRLAVVSPDGATFLALSRSGPAGTCTCPDVVAQPTALSRRE